MDEFEGKNVIVTGGAKGIGRGLCRGFAREGASVFCIDVDALAGRQLVAESKELVGTICYQDADVSSASECRRVVATVISEGKGVDILCNNVGIQPVESYLPAHELPEEQWDRILDVNLKSCFLMTKYCVPEMKRRGGGVIINTASVQGLQSMRGVSAYAASKGGMLSLTRQLALEYAPDNIRVLAINPGSVDTPMVAQAIEASGTDAEKARQLMAEAHPIGRIGQPQDIANLALFLASDRASFMTGEYVCVDGGLMALGAWA